MSAPGRPGWRGCRAAPDRRRPPSSLRSSGAVYAMARCVGLAVCGSALPRDRQKHRDARALPRHRGERDGAAVSFCQALDDGQAETGAAMARALGPAFEPVEHGLLVILWNANTLICNGKGRHGTLADATKFDCPARRREADGVGEEIIEDLRDAPSIGHDRVDAGRDLDLQRHVFLLQTLLHALPRRLDDLAHVDRGELQFQRAGIDGRKVENVVDDILSSGTTLPVSYT